MKHLFILAFIGLFTSKALAQQPIEIKDAKHYVGKRVTITGYVSSVKVFNSSLVRVTISSGDLKYKVFVIRRGKGASKFATSLLRRIGGSEGVITMKSGQSYIYTSTKDFMGLLGVNDPSNCLEGDLTQTVRVDTMKPTI